MQTAGFYGSCNGDFARSFVQMAISTTEHRALADERRGRIVAELQAAGRPLDARELSAALGLHANTVRWHLGILRNAGMVAARAAPRGTPGRPRILYELVATGADRRPDEHRLLATVLAGALSQVEEAPAKAEEAGRAWGRYLLSREPLAAPQPEAAVSEVVELLDQQGFTPAVKGCEIHMRSCPFHDLAETHPDVVCAVHKGLISGGLSALGSDLDVEGLDVFVEPDLCVARLAPRSGETGA